MKKIYSNSKILLTSLAVFLIGTINAQVSVSNGGPVTTYSTVSDAFAAINLGAHTGMISINITGNTTEPSNPVALQASGTGISNYTSVRLRPTTTATISGNPVSGRSVIEIFGADSVIINGDIAGGTVGRDLSIINTNTVGLTAVVRFIGNNTPPALGCRNDVVKNCIIKANVDPTSSTAVASIAGILAGGGLTTSITSITDIGNNFDNLLIENNQIKKTYYGIIVAAGTTSALCADSLMIRKNTIGATDSTEYNVFRGIYLSSCLAAKIYDNSIFNLKPLISNNIAGIEILGQGAVASNDSIVRNTIYGIYMPSTSGFGAYGINLTSGNNHTILNNVIYNIKTNNYSNTSTTYNAFGIRLAFGTAHKIYYNSINMYGNNTGTATSCGSAALVVTTIYVTGLDIKNNIFNNKMTSTAATKSFYAVWFPTSYNFTTTNLNNNAYMVSGNPLTHYVGAVGAANLGDLATWKTFSQFTNPTNDVNSIPPANGTAPFIADNNLRIANNVQTLIESGATAIPGIGLPNTDFLLNSRPKSGVNLNANPDIGAYEIDCIPNFLDFGVSAILKPVNNATKCFNGVDTILIRVKNNYINNVNFTNINVPVKVKILGPNPVTYTLVFNNGNLSAGATKDTLVTLNYDMSKTGTYIFKAYTDLPGDGSSSNDTTILTITKKPVFDVTATPNDSVCRGTNIQLQTVANSGYTVGNGTLANLYYTYPAPYGHYYDGARHQFLFLASELTAAGLVAGNITSLQFNVTALNGTAPLTSFNIGIATTTLTSLSSFQTTGFTTYHSTASYTPVVGINTHTFSSSFAWNGTSNIIVETCFNTTPFSSTSNVSVLQSATSFISSVWRYADNDATMCSNTSSNGSMAQRPNITFVQPATLTYTWAPMTGLSATNIPNPSISNLINTSVPSVTVTNVSSGCVARDTINLFVKPTPTPHLGVDTLYCTFPVTINANTAANSYLWNNNTIASSLNITSAGQYWVKASNSNGCFGIDTVNITLGATPVVTLGADTAYCQGSTINLYAGYGIGNTYLWSTGSTAPSITVGTTGTYSVVVTNSLGCVNSDVVNVTSKPKPNVSLTFSGQTAFCLSNTTGRPLTEGLPTGGTYIGAGVTSSTFYANQAGQGAHIILYNYTGPNGCSNIARDTLVVNACVGIEEVTDYVKLNVFPNPNTGLFTLEVYNNSEMNGNVTITSIDGKSVYNDTINGNGFISKQINVSEIANGIYYLKVSSKESVKTFKLIKQ